MRLLLRWLISAISLMIIARFVDGFVVRDFIHALIAAAVIGFINATLGLVVKLITFPLTILTLGFFLVIVNAIMLKFAAALVPGFAVRDWFSAIVGAILLSLISSLLHWLIGDKRRERREEY